MTDEFVGNQKQFKTVEQCVVDGIPVLIYGPPGIGKTYTAQLLAKKYKYKIVEYNTSDERKKADVEKIKREVVTPSLFNKLYLFDEFDGVENYNSYKAFLDIIKNSFYPVVLTANDLYKIPGNIMKEIEKVARVVRYYRPRKRDVIEKVKSIPGGVDDYNYSNITNDIRNSEISVITGAETYNEEENIFEIVKNIFKQKPFEAGELKDKNIWVWLIDNLTKFHQGKDIFDTINILADASLYNNMDMIKGIKPSNSMRNPTYPHFFKRVKAYREGR